MSQHNIENSNNQQIVGGEKLGEDKSFAKSNPPSFINQNMSAIENY